MVRQVIGALAGLLSALTLTDAAALAQTEETVSPFTLSGSTRWRYETLANQFRAGRTGGDQALSVRTLLNLETRTGPVRLGAELIDSRVYLNDSGSPVSTSNVNTLDILRAYIKADLAALGTPAAGELTLGRMTIDLGSRRFVGRNGFRNTRNAFTGARVEAALSDSADFTAFFVVPVGREPSSRSGLLDNEQAFDEENWDQQFWAAHLSARLAATGLIGELYMYGLQEQDAADTPTADRELYTPGFRLVRPPAPGAWDFEVEHAIQLGSRSASSDPGAAQLDVRAHTHHAHIGYTFDAPWSPRLSLEYDFASGEEAGDGDWTRWDTLYGLRRTDFGQTGIHGPLRRQNVSGPGVRLRVSEGRMDGRVQVKAAWLASDTDTWAGAGVADPAGRSGSHIGTHIAGRMRYWAIPDRLRLETGGAVFLRGAFAKNAPNAPGNGDTVFAYVQATASF